LLGVYGTDDIFAFVVALGYSEGVEGTLGQPASDLGAGEETSCVVVAETAGEMVQEFSLLRAGNVEREAVDCCCIEDQGGHWAARCDNCCQRQVGSSCIGGGGSGGGEGKVGGCSYDPLSGIIDVESHYGYMVVGVE